MMLASEGGHSGGGVSACCGDRVKWDNIPFLFF
jgi:hypothetical protein